MEVLYVLRMLIVSITSCCVTLLVTLTQSFSRGCNQDDGQGFRRLKALTRAVESLFKIIHMIVGRPVSCHMYYFIGMLSQCFRESLSS